MSFAHFGCFAFAALLVPLTATADAVKPDYTEKSIEELMQVEISTVVAASRHEQKVTEAPAAVSVVAQQDIRQFGYRTLADILSSVRGINIKCFAGVEVQASGSRQPVPGNRVPVFLICNATLLGREIAKGIEVSASVYNVFDAGQRDPVSHEFMQDSILRAGRMFRAKLTYRF